MPNPIPNPNPNPNPDPTYEQVRQPSMADFDVTKYTGRWCEHALHDYTLTLTLSLTLSLSLTLTLTLTRP